VRGPTVSPGYFQNPEATREVFDPDGWYHTGDLGALENDGSLRIVGRKKDIFYCADGSNIYPAFIELQLESDSFIRQAVLLGDHRPFIAALVVPERVQIAKSLGCSADVLTDQQIKITLDQRIARLNARLEHFERIQKFLMMKEDFPLEVRSVNAFQKVKVDRKKAAEHFQKQIEEIYAAPAEELRL
jgi:long-chain acyl-CoA synthetase